MTLNDLERYNSPYFAFFLHGIRQIFGLSAIAEHLVTYMLCVINADVRQFSVTYFLHFPQLLNAYFFMPTVGGGGIVCTGRPSVVRPLTSIGHAAISLYLVEGFQWNLAQIFVMWVVLLNVFKIRGQRSEGQCHDQMDCEAYILRFSCARVYE